MPAGLTNLGNTCYMNATVQCLKTVPELRDALRGFPGGVTMAGSMVPSQSITAALRDLYDSMDKGASIPPIILLQVLHMAFPRFAEKSEHGGFTQQDANECWTELVRMLQQKLPPKATEGLEASSNYKSVIDQYFGGTFDCELKCTEAEDEPPTSSKENFLQLSCFISQEVRYMVAGLRSKMQEQITKQSPSLERDAVYTKTEYEDKKVEAAQLDKGIKSKGDGHPKAAVKHEPFSFVDDIGSNNSGYYTLQAVLTHRGRSSSIAEDGEEKDAKSKSSQDVPSESPMETSPSQ
ncbi:Ubiquitin carboxyl-terminal hydrolase 14 [Blattella germanica]|nr:Ubiquitin carboxyl-terminal hydrolase 14 [Blattella germanica]